MTESRVSTKGGDKVRNYFIKMPKKLDKFVSRGNLRFMEKVRDDAKRFSPKDTGSLEKDIKLGPVRRGKNIKIWKIIVDNPAAGPQEFGFAPHFAPIINSSKIPPGIYFVRKNTPFIRPALEKNLSLFSQKLNTVVRRAIAK